MKIKKPQFGDLSTYIVKINGEDVTEAIAQVLIIQDMLTPFISCQIDVIDTTNMITNLGIKVGSKVSITLKTEQGFDTDASRNITLTIYDIGNKRQQNHKALSYTLQASQEDFIKNQTERVCKAFEGKKPHEIVKEVVREYLSGSVSDKEPKPEQIKPHTEFIHKDGSRKPSQSDNQLTYIAPNITPLSVIAIMSRIALSSGKADFVFYTKTINGDNPIYSFESISTIWKRKPHVKFVQRPNHIRKNGETQENKNLEFTEIHTDHTNAIANIVSGYDANTLYSYDFISKKWESSDKTRKGGDVVGKAKSNVTFLPVMPKIFDDGDSIMETNKEWHGSRRNSIFALEQNRTKIQLLGTPIAFDWLSEICEIDIPSNDAMGEQALDSKYKGKYIIASVAHIISRGSYHVNLELVNGNK